VAAVVRTVTAQVAAVAQVVTELAQVFLFLYLLITQQP
jgi:hypothetical protein